MLTPRRLLAAVLLSANLTGCGPFQTASPNGQTATSVIVEITATTTSPTVMPAATATAAPAAPGAVPSQGEDTLPALSDSAWYELARTDLDGDGVEERALSLFNQQVEPRQGFADEYLAGRAMMADVLVFTEADGTIALQLDRTGLRGGDAELRAFTAKAAPASFVVALDPGAPYLLTVMPLAANGLQNGEIFVVTAEQGGYTVIELPQDNLATRPGDAGAPAEELNAQAQLEVVQWALKHLAEVMPGKPAVVAAVTRAGDYAVAHALVFGEQRSRALYLRDDADGWSVVLDTTQAGASVLEGAGVPLALADADPRFDVVDAAAAHLQDPRGKGLDGSLVIEAFDGSWARLSFVPTDRDLYDTPTMFFAGTQSGWQFITAGTAFRPEDYAALGIPESVR